VSDRDTKTKDLFQLELDGRTDLGELAAQVLRVRDWRGEFAGFGETGPEQTGDLLEESFRAQERVILLRELLDQLLILIQPVYQVRKPKEYEDQIGTHFFRSSTLMYSSSICLARSMSAASPSRQIDILGLGTLGNLFANVIESMQSRKII
jgi:hypothetical protein